MRTVAGLVALGFASAAAFGAVSPAQAQIFGTWGAKPAQAEQKGGAAGSAAAANAPSAAAKAPAQVASKPCANPNGLGLARTVEIDTTGGPGFGMEQYKAYDFLQDHEVVLTFDDGPWPGSTKSVLQTLDNHCTKATFFIIGKHALWHPEILKEVAAHGHTIGTHTWSHANLAKAKPDKAREEIEKGFSAVKLALGGPTSSFFRFPALQDPKPQVEYLGQRNVAIFSMDLDSFDFKMRQPEQVVKSVMDKLEKKGKGIILMHDFQQATAHAAPDLLKKLKEGGYKVVQIVGKTPVEPQKEYVDAVLKEMGGGLEVARPMSSVIQTIQGN
jgi:peptidoglycan/xylan/chitin deacetylase (PgdA/CDA1 family)